VPDVFVDKAKMETPKGPSRGMRSWIQAVATFVLWAAILFICAGRLDWTRGWITMAVFAISMPLVMLSVQRSNPGLMEARAKFRRKDTKPFDKIFLAIYLPLGFVQPAVAGLDVVRFGWSSIPFATVYPGVFLFIMAMILVTWTLSVNPHAESTVRIQSDRGHTVITSGPYRVVRHPFYVGASLMYPAVALMLGSMWALATAGLIVILLIWRTAMEDRTLRRELPGYEEYTAVTRYRLVPGVW
jgi:protein-S-isoprenylcysteine O-methyltransferase Ste14